MSLVLGEHVIGLLINFEGSRGGGSSLAEDQGGVAGQLTRGPAGWEGSSRSGHGLSLPGTYWGQSSPHPSLPGRA